MLFYILLFSPILFVIPGALIFIRRDLYLNCRIDKFITWSTFALLASTIPLIISFVIWGEHESRLKTIYQQDIVIKSLQERMGVLRGRPDANGPILLQEILNAEEKIIVATNKKQWAIYEIEAVRKGPASGVISFVGDYK